MSARGFAYPRLVVQAWEGTLRSVPSIEKAEEEGRVGNSFVQLQGPKFAEDLVPAFQGRSSRLWYYLNRSAGAQSIHD